MRMCFDLVSILVTAADVLGPSSGFMLIDCRFSQNPVLAIGYLIR